MRQIRMSEPEDRAAMKTRGAIDRPVAWTTRSTNPAQRGVQTIRTRALRPW